MSAWMKWAVMSSRITTVLLQMLFLLTLLADGVVIHCCHCGFGGRGQFFREPFSGADGVHGESAITVKPPSEIDAEAGQFFSLNSTQYFVVNLAKKTSSLSNKSASDSARITQGTVVAQQGSDNCLKSKHYESSMLLR